jgi:hypothetical protein
VADREHQEDMVKAAIEHIKTTQQVRDETDPISAKEKKTDPEYVDKGHDLKKLEQIPAARRRSLEELMRSGSF